MDRSFALYTEDELRRNSISNSAGKLEPEPESCIQAGYWEAIVHIETSCAGDWFRGVAWEFVTWHRLNTAAA
jgi:hypothetical protein